MIDYHLAPYVSFLIVRNNVKTLVATSYGDAEQKYNF